MYQRYYMLIACIAIHTALHGRSPLDDLLIKNNTKKQIGIIWFNGTSYTQNDMANLLSPAILAPQGKTVAGVDPYLPNSDEKALKKIALQQILNSKTPLTGALFFDMDNMDEQRLVKFQEMETGKVKREGKNYILHEMTIIEPPTYPVQEWQVVKGFDVQPQQYTK